MQSSNPEVRPRRDDVAKTVTPAVGRHAAFLARVRPRIKREVADPARAEDAKQTLAELKTEIKRFEKAFAKSGKELSKLYKDHGAEGEEIQTVLDELNASWEASQRQAIDLRFELKESLTAEEWSNVLGDE